MDKQRKATRCVNVLLVTADGVTMLELMQTNRRRTEGEMR